MRIDFAVLTLDLAALLKDSNRGKLSLASLNKGATVKTYLLQLDSHDVPRGVEYTIIELGGPATTLANF